MSKSERLEHLAAWRASGLTGSAYCQLHGLKYSTFRNWVSVLGKKEELAGHSVELAFKGDDKEELRIILPN